MSFTIPQPEQPGISVLVALFQHNTWASLKLLDFCAGLSDEQLDATAAGTYGSIRDTLLHLVRAEVGYVRHVNGKQPQNPPPRDQFPGFEVLREAVRWTGDELLQVSLAARADTMVTQRHPKAIEQYKLTDLMVQAVSHSIEHREQVSNIITQLGLEPPDMSGWQWMDEKGELWVIDQPAAE
ncbi:MAG: hypothetical protein EXR62_18555 [Chloroflexi bacterium]|nr:hypothetical protein [Chloroflexota bacterium]